MSKISRRDFLKLMGLLGIGLFVGPFRFLTSYGRSDPVLPPRPSVKIGRPAAQLMSVNQYGLYYNLIGYWANNGQHIFYRSGNGHVHYVTLSQYGVY